MGVVALVMFSAMTTYRRVLAALVRVALILLIALILAGLATVRQTNRLAVIAVVDVSGSIQRQPADGVEAVAAALAGPGSTPRVMSTLDAVRAQLLRATGSRRPDDLLGIVAFDGRPILVASPSPTPDLADRPLDYQAQDGTNIADALTLAATLIPSDATGKILLITDGVQTSGDALAAARQIASASAADFTSAGHGLPIDVVPLHAAVRPEVIVESVDAPPLAAIGAPVIVRAIIKSTDATVGTVHLLDNGAEVDINGDEPGMSRRVRLGPGSNLVIAEVPVGVSRVHRFKVVYDPDPAAPGESPGDKLADNNSAEAFTITPAIGSVLLVDGVSEFGEAQAPSPLAGTLRDAGINVSVVSASGMPTDLLSLQNYDLVILEDVPADAVSLPAQQALVAHVRDLGGGLIMVGGPMSFGAGGWKGSPVEALLPVRLDLPDTLVEPEAAIMFVLDNSGSMGRSVMGSSRSQQDLANESAARAVLTLGRRDLIGIIVFNSEYDVVVPLGPNAQPTKTAEAIREISAGGGTNAGPALEEARRALSAVKAKVKHVVLLSDGKSQRSESLPFLAAQMRAEGITVSCISIGDSADLQTMKAIADKGGGEHFNPTNPNVLPRIFLKAIRVARTPMYREEPFDPVITDDSMSPLRGVSRPPPLGGLNLTQPRPEPTIVNAMTSPKGEPLLASWRVELGQVAAFTSDAGEWASGWIGWPGYAQFWAQLSRTMSRPAQQRQFQTRLEAKGDQLRIQVDAVDDQGRPMDFLSTPTTLYSPSGEQVELSLKQTASGVYEGTARASETGTYVAVIRPSAGDRKFPPVIAGASVRTGLESQRLEPDPALVKAIAAESGGSVVELADLDRAPLFERSGLTPRRTLLPLVDVLLPWALAALLLDIAMRRIAWDRVLEERAEVPIAAGRSLAERLAAAPISPAAREEPVSPVAFTERDAADLVKAQRDRRMAERLAAARATSASSEAGAAPARPFSGSQGGSTPAQGPNTSEPSAAPDPVEGGLAAAKRRARQRFEE